VITDYVGQEVGSDKVKANEEVLVVLASSGPTVEDWVHSSNGLGEFGPVENGAVEVHESDGRRCVDSNRDHLNLGRSMSENLDLLIKDLNYHFTLQDNFTTGVGTCSDFIQPVLEGGDASTKFLSKVGELKNRKSTPRIQSLPSMGIPKCLRFVGDVQTSSK
jgi:hypothetical protein